MATRGFLLVVILGFAAVSHAQEALSRYSVRRITSGPKHHLFGYIGQIRTIPWNRSGRFVLALRSDFQDHMPAIDEPAEILLLDTQNEFQPTAVEETRGWNLQQGAMMYWNPEAPESQFFFNDRDPESGDVFAVLYDIEQRRRVREYRFPDSPVANSGVAQEGGWFLAINYGRLARLRLVTGLAGAEDWSRAENAPTDDGIFIVDVATGKRRLLVSYADMRERLRGSVESIDDYALFLNHTLPSREGSRVYFYVRANFKSPLPKVDVPMTVKLDGTGLAMHRYLGGHPEWDSGGVVIGSDGELQVRYDVVQKRVVGSIGEPGTFADPGGDIALSSDGRRLINGHKRKELQKIFFTVFDRDRESVLRTEGFPIGDWLSGATRIDPAPCWNRQGNQVLFGALDEASQTRQLFLLTLAP